MKLISKSPSSSFSTTSHSDIGPAKHFKPLMEFMNPPNMIPSAIQQDLAMGDMDKTMSSLNALNLVVTEYNVSKIEFIEAKENFLLIRNND